MNKLLEKLLEVQKELKNPVLNKVNPFFKSKYADLPSILDLIKPILNKHELVLLQTHKPDENNIIVNTIIFHISGEKIESELLLPVKDKTPQGYGSSITYARRYSILSLLGISADEDDDGNISSNTKEKKENPIKEISKELTIADIQKEIGFNNSHRNHMNQYDLKGKDVIRIFNELYHLMISKKTKWNEVELKDEIDIWLEKNKIAKK